MKIFFQFILFLFMYIYTFVYRCAWECRCLYMPHPGVQLETVVRCLLWVKGIELGSSVKSSMGLEGWLRGREH